MTGSKTDDKMCNQHVFDVLGFIVQRLDRTGIDWVVTGSCGMRLQGVPVDVRDIDLQTDRDGAYAIEHHLPEYRFHPVRHSGTEQIRSHFGALVIDGVSVEIMGALQKRLPDGRWEAPVDVRRYRRWAPLGTLRVPVLSLEYEYRAYRLLGRHKKAEQLRHWLDTHREACP